MGSGVVAYASEGDYTVSASAFRTNNQQVRWVGSAITYAGDSRIIRPSSYDNKPGPNGYVYDDTVTLTGSGYNTVLPYVIQQYQYAQDDADCYGSVLYGRQNLNFSGLAPADTSTWAWSSINTLSWDLSGYCSLLAHVVDANGIPQSKGITPTDISMSMVYMDGDGVSQVVSLDDYMTVSGTSPYHITVDYPVSDLDITSVVSTIIIAWFGDSGPTYMDNTGFSPFLDDMNSPVYSSSLQGLTSWSGTITGSGGVTTVVTPVDRIEDNTTGILDTLKSVFDFIPGLFRGNGISDIPAAIDTWATDHLGILYQSGKFIVNLYGTLIDGFMSGDDYDLRFPDLVVHLSDKTYVLYESTSIDSYYLRDNAVIATLRPWLSTAVYIMCGLAIYHVAHKTFEEVLSR